MPDWERLAELQERGHRSMYSAEVLAEMDRTSRESARKSELLGFLRSDPKFREEIRKILNTQE